MSRQYSRHKALYLASWDRDVFVCYSHAPVGLEEYDRYLCRHECLRYQNWHLNALINFPSENHGYEIELGTTVD